jgi:hypothetical protein
MIMMSNKDEELISFFLYLAAVVIETKKQYFIDFQW